MADTNPLLKPDEPTGGCGAMATSEHEEHTQLWTIAYAQERSRREREQYLRIAWGLHDLRVRGRLEKGHNDIWWLADVRTEDGARLEYPLADYKSEPGLGNRDVYVGSEGDIDPELRRHNIEVSVQVRVTSQSECERRGNPLRIRADAHSIQILTRIPSERVFRDEDGSIAIAETVRLDYIEQCRGDATAELRELTERVNGCKEEIIAVERVLEETRRQHREEQHALKIARVGAAELEGTYEQRKQELATIKRELAAAQQQRDRERAEIAMQASRLRAYVKSQIEPLRRLELITEAQGKALVPDGGKAGDQTREGFPLFDGKTTLAIDHIQRYLFGNNTGYPWDLLANFHALLCTGDLIILSGLSGSGKTNLVKSYAEATGNEARIIPVKPNWTSAEDLLGFHNPLQRAYATTPFLEALFEASRDPQRLYIVCLDEMNLARVEYYFADFLSRLEDRTNPSIDLYPDGEAGHVLTELRVLMQTLGGMGLNLDSANLETLLADGQAMSQLAERLGLGHGESFAQLHARVRRMLSGALTVPARLQIPANVRFVGTVNMDDTTHYLSPKVLDRAHVLQFQSRLDYWQLVSREVGQAEFPTHGIRIPAGALPPRAEYPPYRYEDPLVVILSEYGRTFLAPLGIEVGIRPLRQAIHYRDRLADLYEEGEGLQQLALNNLLRQKVFPRFSFDGKQSARGRGEQTRDDVARQFRDRLADDLAGLTSPKGSLLFRASDDLAAMIERAKANDGVYNYWA